MRLLEKLYRNFCADEVKLMLNHMEENLADFDDHNNKWSEIFCAKEYTTVERAALGFAYKRLKKNLKRQKLLAQILSQKLNPEKVEHSSNSVASWRTSGSTMSALHNQALSGQPAQYNQLLSQQMQQQYELALHNYKKP